jgi:glycosyltransferase involved in cell wall biosynthesis
MSLRILMVSYWFEPSSNTSAQRATRLARYLAEHEEPPSVVTVAPGLYGDHVFDEDELREALPTYEVPESRIHGLLGRLGTPGNVFRNYLMSRAFRRGIARALSEGPQPDFIYWWGIPFWYFPLAPRFLRKTGIPYVLDFVDLWDMGKVQYAFGQRTGLRRVVDRLGEWSSIRKAELVVTTTDAQTRFYRRRYSRKPNEDFMTVRWGYDRETLAEVEAEPPDDDVFRVVVVGKFSTYNADHACYLAEAVARMGESEQRVEVHHYGTKEPALSAAFRDAGAEGQLTEHGFVPYDECLRAVATAGCGVVNPVSPVSISVKTYDYIGLKRPVLGFAPMGSELAQFLKSYPAARLANSTEGTEAALRFFMETDLQATLGDFDTKPYSQEHQFGLLVDRLKALKEARD